MNWATDQFMNYDNFEKYMHNKEVYSNELHVVLSKTPPRLFKLILLAIAFGIVIFAAFGFFVKTKEYVTSGFVLLVEPGHASKITCLADDLTLSKIIGSRSALVQTDSPQNSFGKQELLISFDTLYITPVYQDGDSLYDSFEQVKDKLLSNPRIVKKYRVSILLDSSATSHYFGNGIRNQSGSLKFSLGESRLINRFI